MNARSMCAVLACWLAIAACALVLGAATDAAAQTIDAKEYWLDNGMQVLMVERHEAPTVMCAIVARVGSSNETTEIGRASCRERV